MAIVHSCYTRPRDTCLVYRYTVYCPGCLNTSAGPAVAAGDGVTIQDCGPSCWPAPFGMLLTVLIAVSMAVCIVITTFGNLLVIVSFAVDRQIRQPTNYFICSLAVTDVLIGTVSMPFYTVSSSSRNTPHLFAKFWIFILSLYLNFVMFF